MNAALTVRQLEYFTVVARESSLAAAAQYLHVTPGSLSSALTALEDALGVKLFVRQRSKGVALTSTGQELLVHAQQVLSSVESLEMAAGSVRNELSGRLHVGCFETLSPWVVPSMLQYFAKEHPKVEISLHESSSDELQWMLHQGQLDAAYLYRFHATGALENSTVTDVRLQVVLSASHRLAHEPEIHLEDLSNEPAIFLALKPAPDLVISMIESLGFSPNVRWRSRNIETIRSVVGLGLAYSIIMGRPTGDRSYRGDKLVYKPIANNVSTTSVELIYAPAAMKNAKVRALRQFSKNYLNSPVTPSTAESHETHY